MSFPYPGPSPVRLIADQESVERVTFDLDGSEVRAILEGSAEPLAVVGADLGKATMCGACGVIVAHRPSHARFHAALLGLFEMLQIQAALAPDDEPDVDTAASNEPRIGADGRPV